MHLTKLEEKILNGEFGLASQKAMRLIVAVGDIFNADKLIDVKSSQISGISYKNIGDAGIELIEDFEKLKAKIKTFATLNPAGMDLKDYKEMSIPDSFALKQLRIVKALSNMGATPSCTCTPYLVGNLPVYGEHISWAESSAVCFANSILGARTNREGGPLSLACAITGKTANYGFHLEENRQPTVRVKVKTELKTPYEYGLLGYFIGRQVKDGVPLIEGLKFTSVENLKALCAAAASSGNIGLFLLEDSPQLPKDFDIKKIRERIEFSSSEFEHTLNYFRLTDDFDIVTLGCPHATLNEIRLVAQLLKGKRLRKGKSLWVCTSLQNKLYAERLGYNRIIRRAGGFVAADTCMVVAPLEEMGFKGLATNSAKAAHYVPSTCKLPVNIQELSNLIEIVISG